MFQLLMTRMTMLVKFQVNLVTNHQWCSKTTLVESQLMKISSMGVQSTWTIFKIGQIVETFQSWQWLLQLVMLTKNRSKIVKFTILYSPVQPQFFNSVTTQKFENSKSFKNFDKSFLLEIVGKSSFLLSSLDFSWAP